MGPVHKHPLWLPPHPGSPPLQPQPWGWPPPALHTWQARVAPGTGSLASMDKSGTAFCSAGPKEWTSPWELGQGPLELLPGVGWPGGLPGTTEDEWVG